MIHPVSRMEGGGGIPVLGFTNVQPQWVKILKVENLKMGMNSGLKTCRWAEDLNR